ncbi:UreD urease accessory protein-domain-containing protein [Thamnocephalis sphaerospora]|uniref:UreD urease accessory protein-domain-containing protein n=1 Tax=Thamnocephalis sphaerospora TaxID=78915 RepID=A0A4P9XK38_9FUNG|nr:UreD urease accessory protein-domain-containing protein [Thamnocephalis sphaerospora]|eukprot:RKP06157.1 UreD urease accessory protein-domain-containing protein [Thamnocephalis sphaerospora]
MAHHRSYALAAGDGEVRCELGPDGRATLPTMRARYPLKLLEPRSHQAKSALIYALTYGGGLVSGDCASMKLTVGRDAALTMLTQGSTKVFKRRKRVGTSPGSPAGSQQGNTTYQRVDARIAEDAVLLLLPDPVTCYEDADFWRHEERGESWQFHRYDSALEVYRRGRLVVSDRTLLQMRGREIDEARERMIPPVAGADYAEDAHLTKPLPFYASALEPYRCHATLVVCGERVEPVAKHIRAEFAKVTVQPRGCGTSTEMRDLVWSASDMRDETGVIVRAAARTTEQLRQWMRALLCDLAPICGEVVFERVLTS